MTPAQAITSHPVEYQPPDPKDEQHGLVMGSSPWLLPRGQGLLTGLSVHLGESSTFPFPKPYL